MFYRDPAFPMSGYPPLGDMPFILFAGFPWDWLASSVHSLAALITLLLLNRSMRNLHVHEKSRQLVLLSWIITPTVLALTTWCYVDLWLCALAMLAVERLTLSYWRLRDALIFGLALGLMMLTKYNGIPLAFSLGIAALWRYGNQPKAALKYSSLFSIVAVITAGWWYVWNWTSLGSPLFPLGNGPGISWLQFRIFAYQEGGLWASLAPLRQFFWGEINNPRLFDGMLHPLWLALFAFPWMWKRNRRATSLLLAVVIYTAFAITTSIRARYWLPGLTVGLPVLALVIMKIKSPKLQMLFAISFAPPLISSIIYLASLQPWTFWLQGRDAFLNTKVVDYQIQKWASENLREDATVHLLWTGGRAYYLNRPFSINLSTRKEVLLETTQKLVNSNDYILFNRYLAKRSMQDNEVFWQLFGSNSCLLAQQGPFELWHMIPCSASKDNPTLVN